MSASTYWSPEEDALLLQVYPTTSNADLLKLFPTRPIGGIRQRAHQIGVQKNIEAHERGKPYEESVIGHLTETEKGYLAGIIDGEGCIRLARRFGKNGDAICHIYVAIANTSQLLYEWLENKLPGKGYIRPISNHAEKRPNTHPEQWKPCYTWIVSGNRIAITFLREIAPYLIIKRKQAELLAGGYVHLSNEERNALFVRLRELKGEG
jgi:hypothetical protein